MTSEVFKLMQHFKGSYINYNGELILSDKGNVYFIAKDCLTMEDIVCKLLEWCSRPLAKGIPYSHEKNNEKWRNGLISCLNDYLGTDFSQKEMYMIYEKLGNGVNHELTLRFVRSGYDMQLLYD